MRNKNYLMMAIFIALTLAVIPLFSIPVRIQEARLTRLEGTLSSTDVKRDVPITMTLTLPDENVYRLPALLVQTRFSSLQVFLDGEALFAHDVRGEDDDAYPGWGAHYIDLPADYASKQVEIVLTPVMNNAFGGMAQPILGSHTDLILYTAYLGLLPLLVALFLCVYGVVFILLSLFFAVRTPAVYSQACVALLCLISGVWALCYHEFFSLLTPNGHAHRLEYLMQFLAVPVFFLYLYFIDTPGQRKRHAAVAIALYAVEIAALTAEFLTGRFANHLMLLYLAFVLIGLFISARYYIDALREGRAEPSELVQIVGVIIYLASCFAHIVLYFLQDYNGMTRDVFGRNVMTLGVAAFLESQLLNYFFYVARNFAAQIEYGDLEEMAYRDFLTGLPNRTDAERVFDRIAETSDDFCVVMLDLNDLKIVNDRSGHDAGDRLLKDFADALRATLGNSAYLARIGGDEFLAILEGVRAPYVERQLQKLDEELRRLDVLYPDIAHSAAYGYAFRHECAEGNIMAPYASSLAAKVAGEEGAYGSMRRRAGDQRILVKTENKSSSESRYAQGVDILQRVAMLADRRMYEKKRVLKSRRVSTTRSDYATIDA